MEILITGLHHIQINDNVIGSGSVLGIPTLTIIISHSICPHNREIISDRLLIQCCDGLDGDPTLTISTIIPLPCIWFTIICNCCNLHRSQLHHLPIDKS